MAETLSGKNNPAGRLPVTFYTGVEQLPNFEDYGMTNRTYRYFESQAALSLWLRAQLHDFQVQRSERPNAGRGSRAACGRRCHGDQHGQGCWR